MFWDRAVTPSGCWPSLQRDLSPQHLSCFTLSKFLASGLANVFASLFWLSCGCRLPSCWNNMKGTGTCDAGSLIALLLLRAQASCIPSICFVVLGKYPFGHQFVSLVLLLPFTVLTTEQHLWLSRVVQGDDFFPPSLDYLLKPLEIWGFSFQEKILQLPQMTSCFTKGCKECHSRHLGN